MYIFFAITRGHNIYDLFMLYFYSSGYYILIYVKGIARLQKKKIIITKKTNKHCDPKIQSTCSDVIVYYLYVYIYIYMHTVKIMCVQVYVTNS